MLQELESRNSATVSGDCPLLTGSFTQIGFEHVAHLVVESTGTQNPKGPSSNIICFRLLNAHEKAQMVFLVFLSPKKDT